VDRSVSDRGFSFLFFLPPFKDGPERAPMPPFSFAGLVWLEMASAVASDFAPIFFLFPRGRRFTAPPFSSSFERRRGTLPSIFPPFPPPSQYRKGRLPFGSPPPLAFGAQRTTLSTRGGPFPLFFSFLSPRRAIRVSPPLFLFCAGKRRTLKEAGGLPWSLPPLPKSGQAMTPFFKQFADAKGRWFFFSSPFLKREPIDLSPFSVRQANEEARPFSFAR